MEPSRRTVDVAVAAIIFLVGVAVMAETHRLGIGWVKDAPASGYFPFRIGAILALAGAAIAVQALLDGKARAREPFVSRERFRLVLAVLVPTAAYVLGVSLLGIYVASAVFMAGFMRLAGKFGWLASIALGAACAAVLFWVFEIQFLVPLPKGPLEAWLGY